MKILIVEDDLEAAAYLSKAFREAGIVLDHASDGESGLFLATENSYDVLVIDRMLPQIRTLRDTSAADLAMVKSLARKTGALNLSGYDARAVALVDQKIKPALARQIEALRLWIGQLDPATPTVLVTHQVVVTAVSEIFPGSGEIVVMQRMADGRLAVQGRLPTT